MTTEDKINLLQNGFTLEQIQQLEGMQYSRPAENPASAENTVSVSAKNTTSVSSENPAPAPAENPAPAKNSTGNAELLAAIQQMSKQFTDALQALNMQNAMIRPAPDASIESVMAQIINPYNKEE